jgi:elongation factor G
VPRIAFVNKLDRVGADFRRVVKMMEEKFEQTPVPVQVPIGAEDGFVGVVDVLTEQAFIWHSDDLGATFEIVPVPQELGEDVAHCRHQLVDVLSRFDERLLEQYVSGAAITAEDLRTALRCATVGLKVVPVFCGSAFKNKGVQKLLDGVADYLPSPLDVPPAVGTDPRSGQTASRRADPSAPFSALVFKLAADAQRGMMSYVRVYSGTVEQGDVVLAVPQMKRVRLPKLALMHANRTQEVERLSVGEIGVVIGLKETATGTTLADLAHPVAFEPIKYPEPVVFLAIEPKTKADDDKLHQSLSVLALEDPTFKVRTDEETGQLVLSGMGELHLEILIDRLMRDYRVGVHSGEPQVSYRETVTTAATAEGRFVRQSGGRGHYAVVKLTLEPSPDGNEVVDELQPGTLPRQFVVPAEQAIRDNFESGVLAGFEVINTKVRIIDGAWHDVDSSDVDFRLAAASAFRDAFMEAAPTFLEPIMELEVVVPDQYVGTVLQDLTARDGRVLHLDAVKGHQIVRAELPLARTFGYATALRSLTQGRASHSMQFARFSAVDQATRERLYPLFADRSRR